MPKILVADDNSNVQKTVALALADLGVEVVAVNNGDAAVRKLGDVMPDLVLADIFMPVRNGYEVCDYVKKDSRFSHVPVVLLVGAFDPLDEREAQRVAADGILKKPFVPPDPLIAMVKTLLDRTLSERLVTVGAAKPTTAAQSSATEVKDIKVQQRPPAPPQPVEVAPEPEPQEEFQPAVDRLSFGDGEHPIAFGQLLESSPESSAATEIEPIEPVSDEQVLTSSRDASLGEPAFWHNEDPEPETEEGNSETEEEDSGDFGLRTWKLGEDALHAHAEPESLQPVQPAVQPPVQPQVQPLELVHDGSDEGGSASTVVETSQIIAQDAASQASLTVQAGKAEDLAANPLEWMATAPTAPLELAPAEAEMPWSTAEPEPAVEADTGHETELGSEPEQTAQTIPSPVLAPVSVPVAAVEPAKFPTPPPSAPFAPPPAKIAASSISDDLKSHPVFKSLNQNADDTARSIPKQDWADLAASLQARPSEAPAEKPQPASSLSSPIPPAPAVNASLTAGNTPPATSSSAAPDAPDPALVEAVVQRVLDKMRPQVVDIITKEFLRPVVQALVHREITKH